MENSYPTREKDQNPNNVCPKCGTSLTEGSNYCPSCLESINIDPLNKDVSNVTSFLTKYKIQSLIGLVLVLVAIIGFGINYQNNRYERMVSSLMPDIANRFNDPSSVTILEGYIDKENDGSRYIGLRISASNAFGGRVAKEYDIRLNSSDRFDRITESDSPLGFYTVLKFGHALCVVAENNNCTVHKLDVEKIRW